MEPLKVSIIIVSRGVNEYAVDSYRCICKKNVVYKHMQAVMQVWYECAFNDVNKHFKVWIDVMNVILSIHSIMVWINNINFCSTKSQKWSWMKLLDGKPFRPGLKIKILASSVTINMISWGKLLAAADGAFFPQDTFGIIWACFRQTWAGV